MTAVSGNVNCVLTQCRQLGSGVRELNDKYPGSCLCLSQRWNIESYTMMLTLGVIILERRVSNEASDRRNLKLNFLNFR